MFDRTKAQLEKLQEDHEAIRKAVQHVKDHRNIYLGAPVLAGVSFIAGKHHQRPIVIDFKPVINNAPIFNNHNIGNQVTTNLGRVSKIVRDTETGKEWMKIKYLAEDLAKEHGLSVDAARVMLRRHFLGELPSVFGKTYEVTGLRTDF